MAVILVASAQAQPEGMIPSWQVEELSEAVVENSATATKVASALRPQQWVAKGAPSAYVSQHQTLVGDLERLVLSAQAMGREPERLTYAVDTFLWLDRVDSLMSSVAGGVRRYHNPAVADLLDSARNRNTDSIATLKLYMRQLADHVETSMDIAHREAQRCREEILTRPRPKN